MLALSLSLLPPPPLRVSLSPSPPLSLSLLTLSISLSLSLSLSLCLSLSPLSLSLSLSHFLFRCSQKPHFPFKRGSLSSLVCSSLKEKRKWKLPESSFSCWFRIQCLAQFFCFSSIFPNTEQKIYVPGYMLKFIPQLEKLCISFYSATVEHSWFLLLLLFIIYLLHPLARKCGGYC